MIVIVIMGLMLAMASPKLHDWSASADARGAQTSAISLLARARAAAIQNNQLTTAQFNGTSGAVVTAATNDTLDVGSLGGADGVAMSPSSWSVTYDPRGLGQYQSAFDVTFTKSGKSSSLTVSGYGRISQ